MPTFDYFEWYPDISESHKWSLYLGFHHRYTQAHLESNQNYGEAII
jgi:hypothetical protein